MTERYIVDLTGYISNSAQRSFPSLEGAQAYVATVIYQPEWDEIHAGEGFWYSDPAGAVIVQDRQ